MSSVDFDRLEVLGVAAAFERCGTLAMRIESALAKRHSSA